MLGIGGLVTFDEEKSAQAIAEAGRWMATYMGENCARVGLWQQGRAALIHVAGRAEAQLHREIVGSQQYVLAYAGDDLARHVLDGWLLWRDEWLLALGDAFSLALWQPQARTLTLARGRGLALHVAPIRGGCCFSSDPGAIECLRGWTDVAPSELLPPGTIATFDAGQFFCKNPA